jgi:hypothetical protein
VGRCRGCKTQRAGVLSWVPGGAGRLGRLSGTCPNSRPVSCPMFKHWSLGPCLMAHGSWLMAATLYLAMSSLCAWCLPCPGDCCSTCPWPRPHLLPWKNNCHCCRLQESGSELASSLCRPCACARVLQILLVSCFHRQHPNPAMASRNPSTGCANHSSATCTCAPHLFSSYRLHANKAPAS